MNKIAKLSVFEIIHIYCRAWRDARKGKALIWRDIELFSSFRDIELSSFESMRVSLFERKVYLVKLQTHKFVKGKVVIKRSMRLMKLSDVVDFIGKELFVLYAQINSLLSERDDKIVALNEEMKTRNSHDSMQIKLLYEKKVNLLKEEYKDNMRPVYELIAYQYSEQRRIISKFEKRLDVILAKKKVRTQLYYIRMLWHKPLNTSNPTVEAIEYATETPMLSGEAKNVTVTQSIILSMLSVFNIHETLGKYNVIHKQAEDKLEEIEKKIIILSRVSEDETKESEEI